MPDLVFLDPPYWKQAEGKYSQDETDLSNVELDDFLKHIGDIAKCVKRKWTSAKRKRGVLSLIIGPMQQDGKVIGRRNS